jgi:hypothetical protein
MGVADTRVKNGVPRRRSTASWTAAELYGCPGAICISRRITLSWVLALPRVITRPSLKGLPSEMSYTSSTLPGSVRKTVRVWMRRKSGSFDCSW